MKKVIGTLLMAVIIMSLFMMSTIASDSPAYGMNGKTTVSDGEEFTVSINISGNPGLISLRLTVSYDMEVLELKSVSNSALLSGFTQPSSAISSPYTLRWSDSLATENNTANGTIVTLTFLAKKSAENTEITVSHVESRDKDGGTINFSGTSLNVTVTCNHTYGEWETHNETQHKRVCSKCGNEEYADHTWDDGEVTTEPTCKDTGIKTYTCTACGETKTETVPVTDEHTWGSWEKVDETNHKHTCSVCGKEETAAHTWDEGKVTKEPTCKDTGIRVDTCVCGATKEVTLPVTDEHTWGEWEKDDETNHKHTCSVCGKEEAAAHTWDDGEVTTEPTCKDTGLMTYTCTACGETKTETVPVTDEHTWGEWEIADETNHKHICSVCGKEETSEHTWDEGTVTIEPSGGKEGETTYTCTACGATRTEVIPATHEHSYSEEWRYDGTMHWHICSCGSKRGTQSHAWDDGTVQKEATCTEPGSVLYTCTVCGATKSESISAEHTPGEWTVVMEASCTEDGKQEQRCTVCGTVLKEMTIAATGHTAGAWEEEDGERVRKCTVCGEVLEREAIQTETTSAAESTETTQPEQPTESTEPTDTTAPGGDPGEGSSTAWIVTLIVVGAAVIAVAVVVVVKKKSKG